MDEAGREREAGTPRPPLRRRRRPPRIFVGLVEIGDYTVRLTQGLRALGLDVANVVLEPEDTGAAWERLHDRYLPRTGSRPAYFARLGAEFARQVTRDIFVFNYCTTFAPIGLYYDVALLRALGKKVVMMSQGAELRDDATVEQQLREAGLHEHADHAWEVSELKGGSRAKMLARARMVDRYATHIFSRNLAAQLVRRPYQTLWLPIDLGTVPYRPSTEEPPLVVHAPSNTGVKGTRYVLDAVERLRREGVPFRFELCHRMSNREVRELLGRSAIAVDQLILPGHGNFAVEAMAAGNAVLGSVVKGFDDYGDDLPMITTTPSTIYENLRTIVLDAPARAELAARGRAYVEANHDHVVVAARFLEAIGEAVPHPERDPSYVRRNR